MTVAELVSELLYAGKTRRDIAGYDDAFMSYVLCRRRDEYGELVKNDPSLPKWVQDNLDSKGRWKIRNPKSYTEVFHSALEKQGFDAAARIAAWDAWRRDNPGFGRGG